ncbi:glutamate--tRNA ligase [bacterium]|nr:glutamate--tRNA ligase [candidate division CSSED10-310 bacterium]
MTIRVRIAPSPTGSPHVGTAYMGLFNLAFARHHNGLFVLRVEDTDQGRSRPEYESGIFRALQWMGIQWDEGPDIGGPFGPYRQSERTVIYREHIRILIDKGKAYRCFCTADRLAEMRKLQHQNKLPEGYDGRCRNLSEAEIENHLQNNDPFVIRLRVPDEGTCVINDRLRSEIRYEYNQIDDQILMKSDGYPTYHLANVIDDHLMRITHVIRGEEWVPSTPKHVLLYQSFGWEIPEFIHLPLLLNPDGSKLSKRKNPTSIDYYRDAGFLPEALLNYLGLMSYSRPDQEEKFTLDDFVSDFDIDRVSLGGSIFDLKKLRWLNARYLRENYTPDQLWLKFTGWRINPEFLSRMIPMMQNRLHTLGDFIPACSFLLATDVSYDTALLTGHDKDPGEIAEMLQTVIFQLETLTDWIPGNLQTALELVAAFWELPIRDVTSVLFVAISGMTVAPPLYESMALLGRDMTRRRIMDSIDRLGSVGRKKMKKLEERWDMWNSVRHQTNGEGNQP